ncbi:DUF3147 family protein [Methylococcus geothermalis]|uniref:DUF3147 family protein n=1 Tax=Methylococcus geothermalis TaxID=2681310 RepID=A0A858Q752_9GAMM|nr:DUF3147 family protein [Methylococcus geothermalis]QJD29647.1 hypothetical protein GNH96_06485 [Methylococcus geothermalis]
MLYYAVKLAVSVLALVAITEIAKRSTVFAALVASLPLTSLLAFIWLHCDGAPPGQIADLSFRIFWLVLPSLVLFLLLPLLLKHGLGFWISLAISSTMTALAYITLMALLPLIGIRL